MSSAVVCVRSEIWWVCCMIPCDVVMHTISSNPSQGFHGNVVFSRQFLRWNGGRWRRCVPWTPSKTIPSGPRSLRATRYLHNFMPVRNILLAKCLELMLVLVRYRFLPHCAKKAGVCPFYHPVCRNGKFCRYGATCVFDHSSAPPAGMDTGDGPGMRDQLVVVFVGLRERTDDF